MFQKIIYIVLLLVGGFLFIPFGSVLLSGEGSWGMLEILMFAVLLLGILLSVLLLINRIKSNKTFFTFVVVFLLLFVWVELGVGLIGSNFAGS